MMEELIALISNVGFPIAISMYVLIRLENTLKRNTEAIIQLSLKLK
jgi:hypothetical protein